MLKTETRSTEKVLMTGGVGFIGSHLVDILMSRGANVCVFDNLTAGTLQNNRQWLDSPNLTFIKGDLLNLADLTKVDHNHYEFIFHLAANPEVRLGLTNPDIHFQQNIVATHNLLESLRKTKNKPTIIFTSTSTVYGARLPKIQQEAPQQANASQTEQSHHHIHQTPAENHKH
jgi:UDP-glucose 4-epimerase